MERTALRPALAVRIARVESSAISQLLRAPAEARAPRPAREARAVPREINGMDTNEMAVVTLVLAAGRSPVFASSVPAVVP